MPWGIIIEFCSINPLLIKSTLVIPLVSLFTVPRKLVPLKKDSTSFDRFTSCFYEDLDKVRADSSARCLIWEKHVIIFKYFSSYFVQMF